MASNLEAPHLLRTKLYRPRASGDVIRHARVHELLDCSVDRALTLVCAPAGFGKTTVLSDWLACCPCPNAWLSLDEHDSDLGRFLSYFVAAIRSLFPAACADTLALLRAPVLPPPGPLATVLANDLDRLAHEPGLPAGQRFILVLDDYHLIREPAVHTLLSELLRHPPRTLHLILAARQDPPLPLPALRARSELGEIRIQELRFTAPEVAAFMRQELGTELEADVLAAIVERTEGWVTGLRLAALSMRTGGDAAGRATELVVDNRFVLDYLMSEVLSHIPLATQDFLLKTSVLDRMSGPLCEAVVGATPSGWGGQAYLEWLAAENLFTFSLDAQGTWYRYHHVFQTLLRRRLERQFSSEEVAEFHRRASGWLARNGMIEDAIQHALAAGDEIAAVQLVERYRHTAMNQERWRELERWLSLMPRQLIDVRPELLMLEAWILQQHWRNEDIPPYLDRTEALLEHASVPEPDRMRLQGEVDALRSAVSYYFFDAERTSCCAERALERTPLDCSFVRSIAWFYCAAARQMTGDVQGALDAYYEGLKEDRLHGNAFTTRLYAGLCFMYWMSADPPNLLLAATQLLELGRQRSLGEATAWGHYFRGSALYQSNDLVEAKEELVAVLRHRYLAHGLAFSHAGFGLASIFLARGENDRAREMVDSIAAYALEMRNTRIMADAEAFRAFLSVRTGAVAAAERWALAYDLRTPPVPLATFHTALMARAKILVQIGTPTDLALAAETLDRLYSLAGPTHNTRYLLEILALQALILDAQGNRVQAMATLKESIALAEPGGVIRVFVDLGPQMAILLRRLAGPGAGATRDATAAYVSELLAAFADHKGPPSVGQQPHPGELEPRPEQPGGPRRDGTTSKPGELIEPLSVRELEVLGLLGEWFTNKEIARALSISPQTVKRHTVNIYQKLLVGNRRDAVDKAVVLGLLPGLEVRGRRTMRPDR